MSGSIHPSLGRSTVTVLVLMGLSLIAWTITWFIEGPTLGLILLIAGSTGLVITAFVAGALVRNAIRIRQQITRSELTVVSALGLVCLVVSVSLLVLVTRLLWLVWGVREELRTIGVG